MTTDEDPVVVVDTWSRYSRRHQFVGYPVPGVDRGRIGMRCARCGQTRLVAVEIVQEFGAWGCPRLPWWWRLRHLRRELPSWDANRVPPWVRRLRLKVRS